ncbi:tetratricopeptide repeat protein [Planosporangium sp. 12N6]|uniref:ATP-binding protein n=1 Tax=Planosporangium spinosum TaxID=3402278 RepID=UPI003CED4BAF
MRLHRVRQQPSWLLAAHHQVVPFVGRESELAELTQWRDDRDPAPSVMLIHGQGGQGKTRLAVRFAELAVKADWTVRVASRHDAPSHAGTAGGHGDARPSTAPAKSGTLILVDYAERWTTAGLLTLVRHQASARRARILLLSRSTGSWWDSLSYHLGDELDVGIASMRLEPLAPDVDERARMFATARDSFAEIFDIDEADTIDPPTNLTDEAFGLTLTIHMAALAAVDARHRGATPPEDGTGLATYLLGREREYWRRLHALPADDPAHVGTTPEVLARAVYLGTLTRPVTYDTGRAVLARTRPHPDETAVDRILDDHLRCYPPNDRANVLVPLYPDRLGEDFIALTMPGHPYAQPTDPWTATALNRLLVSDTGDVLPWAGSAVTVLVEAARRWPHLRGGHLYPLLVSHPHLAVAAGAAALTRLAELPDIPMAVLEAVETALPENRHINLDTAAAAISIRLTEARVAQTTDRAERAYLYENLDFRLSNAGFYPQALAAGEQAVALYRKLMDADPVRFTDRFAAALGSYGVSLMQVGRQADALAAGKVVVQLYRRLARENPARFAPDLARELANISIRFDDTHLDRAHDAAVEAVQIRRRIATTYPDANLARYLHNLGEVLWRLGRRREALHAAIEAVTTMHRSAVADPQTWLPDLAALMHSLSVALRANRRTETALAVTDLTVRIYRRLAVANPVAFEPGVAMALAHRALCLSELGRQSDAHAAIQESLERYTALTGGLPWMIHQPLRWSLTMYANNLDELGRAPEAAEIRRVLRDSSARQTRPASA